ncbi:hypothetical protein MUP56_01710 [Patescibacteria group bacterium]|nr:hypothetical protein [Patescibacteria group bacterium]
MKPKNRSSHWNMLLIIAFLIACSLPARLWNLTTSPPLIVDESANVRDINKLLATHEFHPIDFEWGFGQATLVHYPTVLLLRMGVTDALFALRLMSVILSLLALIPFFFIVNTYTSLVVAVSATLLFSSSYYFLQFSRVGWTNVHALSLGLYFLWISMEASRRRSLILSGMAAFLAGLLFYLYRAAEVYIALGTLSFFISIVASQVSVRKKFSLLTVYVIVVAATAYPWIHTILEHWDRYTLREKVVSIQYANLPYHGMIKTNDIMRYKLVQTIRSWIFFLPMHTDNNENLRYLPAGHGAISWGNIALFWIGCAAALGMMKKTYIWFLIYTLGLYAGQVLTVDPPNGSRALLFLPIIYLFIAMGLDIIRTLFPKKSRVASGVILISAITLSILDIAFYIQWMSWITLF